MNEIKSTNEPAERVDPPVLDLCICPQCGAAGVVSDSVCWLCQTPRSLNPYASPDLSVPSAESKRPEVLIAFLVFGCVVLAALAMIGLGIGAPGLIVVVLLATVPAFAIALPPLLRKFSTGNVKTIDVVQTVVLSVALTVGVLGLLIVAGIALLFLVCLYAISNP